MMPRLLSASVEKLGGTTAETEQKPWCRHQSWKQFGTVVPGPLSGIPEPLVLLLV